MSIASPLIQPSPNGRRVGIRIVTFEACSGFTHVTARRIAQPPKATFVARLRPDQLPSRAARQLPRLVAAACPAVQLGAHSVGRLDQSWRSVARAVLLLKKGLGVVGSQSES